MKLHTVLILLVLLFVAAGSAFGQTSVISYQGRLAEASAVENGEYQFQFKLFDAAQGGNQIGSIVEVRTLVTNGAFSAGLDFGEKAFNGEDRYLEISIRKTESDAYVPLTSAREKVNSVPYAIKANTATTAETVAGMTSTDISGSVQTVNNATPNNVGGAIVKRDDQGQIAVSGVIFPDGTVLKSGSFTGGKVVNQTVDNIGGTGTTNRISKWIDGSGTLGDSTISENSQGLVGIGNPNPTAKLSVLDGANAELRFAQGASGITPSLSVISTPSSMTTGGGLTLATGTGGSSFVFSDNLPFYIVKDTKANVVNNNLGHGTLLFTVLPNGNVGAGVVNPTERFEANGNIKISGEGSRLIFPDGTFMTTAGSGGGGNMTGTSIITAVNDASTSGLISDNRVSTNLARLTGANVWSAANVFSAGLSANNSLITNVGNPVNAGDAVNKIYADSNFVKFVPGAEQLSVGDANGTAPMINLRGGSTCCSSPGGHTPAWFKVFQNGSFVATGNLGIGVSPMQGKGYRTSWDSYKGAFRSGYADNEWDDAKVGFFSWAGGSNSTAEGLYALAFGDTNFARSTSSIAFGSGNEVKGAAGFSAGAGNRVCDTYGVALGNNAKSGGPLINGKCDPDTFNIRGLAAFALGYYVTADQDHSFALGKFATNNGFSGTFIWSDGSAQASADTFRNTANNEVAFRATGGFRFRTNLGGTTGCNLPAGSGVFNCTSSRFTKENFLKVEGFDVLSRLRKIPVTSWNYISEGQQVRHIGPMAEDFYEQFKLGTGNTSIGVQDLAGVSIAAVKELDAQLQEKN
ncbi:MAG TPA: tail fiber domain-containing protein, partial [Pyrinomonadaceae bacterium]